MARKNPHIGSSFESWLEEARIREDVTAVAIKAVIARQLASEMKKKKNTKQRMAELMKTSRAQIDRLLDPDNGSATIESLQRAARIGANCGCNWCGVSGSEAAFLGHGTRRHIGARAFTGSSSDQSPCSSAYPNGNGGRSSSPSERSTRSSR
jgi:antitoxin HicB